MKHVLRIDFSLLIPVAVLITISLFTLLSLSPDFFRSQLISLFIALVAFFICSQLNIESIKAYRMPIYIISLVLLLITLGIGIESHGAVRWIDILGIRLQFSEILK